MSETSVTIATASFDDLPSVKKIALASPWTSHITHITYCNRSRFFSGEVLLASVDDIPVGFLIYRKRKQQRDTKIDMISVAPEFAGRGVGQALITHLREVTDGSTVVLSVNLENHHAIAFYEKYGFTKVAYTRDETCWHMRLVGRGVLL